MRHGALVLAALVLALARPSAAGWEEARAAAERGDWAAAERELVAVVGELPEWAPGWALLAGARFHRGDAEAAAEAYERAVALRPENAEYRLGLIQALIAADRAGEAVTLAESVDSTDLAPGQQEAFVLLVAQALLDLDRPGDAVALLEGRLARAESATVARALGRAQEAAGDPGRAVDAFARAFALDPEHELPAMRRAITLARRLAAEAPDDDQVKGRWTARSLELAGLLVAGAPGTDNLRLAAETALAAERPEVAATWLKQAVAEAPADPRLGALLGRSLAESGHPDAARNEFERALALHPSDEFFRELHGRIARLAAAELDFDAAVAHYEKAGDRKRAAELAAIGASHAEAIARRDRLRISIEELDEMRRTLEGLGDDAGVEAVSDRRAAFAAELAGIEANLAEVRAALTGQ